VRERLDHRRHDEQRSVDVERTGQLPRMGREGRPEGAFEAPFGSISAGRLGGYTTFPWPAMCEEIMKLKITWRRRRYPRHQTQLVTPPSQVRKALEIVGRNLRPQRDPGLCVRGDRHRFHHVAWGRG
jgi:hypothetical protein